MVEQKVKRVSDIIGNGKIDFYPECSKVDLETIIGKDVMFMDVMLMKGWKSAYTEGTSDWVLIQYQDMATGENFTTKCGGQVLVKRVMELKARKAFPIVGSIVMQGDSDKPYYNIL